MLWKAFLVVLFVLQLSACTLIGLTMDSKICGDHDKNNGNSFSHNEVGEDEDECKLIFTTIGAAIDYTVIKSLTEGRSEGSSTNSSKPNYQPKYDDNEYSGKSCPNGKKKICFIKEGCHCVNDV